jgi:hypothetical protein
MVLPFVLDTHNSSIISYFYSIVGEIPSVLLTLYLVDKDRFGRKNTLTLTTFLIAIFSLLVYTGD